jgi:predicted ester cyclase
MSAENEALVHRLVDEVWNGGRIEVIPELVGPGYVRHDPGLPGEVHGPHGLEQTVHLYRDAFPDIHFLVEEIASTHETVFFRYRVTGTHRGDLMGIAPTGRRSEVTGLGLLHVYERKIVEEWEQWDQVEMLRKLGVLPERDSVQDKAMRTLSNLRTKVSETLRR